MSVNGIPSYTYIKRILYVQVSTRNSYKFLRILDVYYTYFFDVNDRKNDPKVVRKLKVHYTCNLEYADVGYSATLVGAITVRGREERGGDI